MGIRNLYIIDTLHLTNIHLKWKLNVHFILVISIVLGCFACRKDTGEEELCLRTLLVYLGRDNNLSGMDEDKLGYILQGWNGKDGRLLIFQDTKQDKPCLLEVYHINGENQTRMIAEYENENSADPQLLRQVIEETIRLYPAQSYGLIVFSHASGWLPEGALVAPRSIIEDGKKEMELIDFAAAIPEGLFDFIIFESCFMAGIEVMYELKDKTEYILASSAELLSPGFAVTYQTSIDYLFSEEPDLLQFARDVFAWIDRQSNVYRSGTISLVKTGELTALGNFIRTADWSTGNTDTRGIQYFDRYAYHLFFDFGDYYRQRTDNEAVASELTRLINECVCYKAATPYFMMKYGFEIKSHSGLTTYIEQESYPFLNQEYQKLRWYKEVLE